MGEQEIPHHGHPMRTGLTASGLALAMVAGVAAVEVFGRDGRDLDRFRSAQDAHGSAAPNPHALPGVVVSGGNEIAEPSATSKATTASATASPTPKPTRTSSPSPSPSPTPKTSPSPEAQATCIAKLPLATRVAQTLFIGVYADNLQSSMPVFKKLQPGGAIIMTSPKDPADGSIKRFKNAPKIPLLMGTDQEGGFVQRFFRDSHPIPAPADVAAPGTGMTPAEAQAMMTRAGTRIHNADIDIDMAPLADVAPKDGKSVLTTRVFSNDPAVVVEYDTAYIKGLRAAGIIPVIKHFPGMGGASDNTDYHPATTAPLSELKKRDLIPYKKLAYLDPVVMTGSPVVPGGSDGQPANQSRKIVTDLLRGELGYEDSFVITDSLSGVAIKDPVAAAINAVEVGNDMAMLTDPAPGMTMSQTITAVTTGLQQDVRSGKLSEAQLNASVGRVMAAKRYVCPVS